MGMHAKSLNQLAAELERGHRREPACQTPPTVAPCSPEARLAEQLERLAKTIEHLGAPATSPVLGSVPVDVGSPSSAAPLPEPLSMDSTLGTRLHREEAVQLSKREAQVRLYTGFISRAGIEGQD